MDLDQNDISNTKTWLEAVGLSVAQYTGYNAANLQTMYNALKDGALIIASVDNGISDDGWYHAVVVHGVNANGELLVQDPSNGVVKYQGLNETTPYAVAIQNLTMPTEGNKFLVVTK